MWNADDLLISFETTYGIHVISLRRFSKNMLIFTACSFLLLSLFAYIVGRHEDGYTFVYGFAYYLFNGII